MSERKSPPDRKLDSSRSPVYTHWYNPTLQLEDKPLSASRRGRARERVRRRQQDTRGDRIMPYASWSWWTWGIIVVAVVGVIGVSSVISLIILSSSGPHPAIRPTAIPSIGDNLTQQAAPVVNIHPADLKGRRFTLLVMGLDLRPGDSARAANTDSILVMSIDPTRNSIGILSIPRDLVIPVPGQPDMQRINSLYTLGELAKPGGGPQLVMQTIQYNFGIPVDNYLIVSFQVLIDAVDMIGGIDIQVPEAINDPEYPDMNYGYDPLYIPAGLIHMDGALALKYARTRHEDSDYGRADRQQQVILAIRKKILSGDQLTKLAMQAPDLWTKLSQGVLTDLAFDRALSLGWYAKDIPAEKILRGTVENEYLQAMQYEGSSVVTLNRTEIGKLMVQVFGPDYSH